MDRIVEVKVNGNYISKDSKNAGAQGEYNMTYLRIEFDEGWDGFAKTITWWNARNQNPVKRTLTADLLEDITQSIRIYMVPIPGEPLEYPGVCSFVIDGYAGDKRQSSVQDELVVKPSPRAENADDPIDPNPTQAEQLQVQIDTILDDMQERAIRAENAADGVEQLAQEAAEDAAIAKESEEIATRAAAEAEEAMRGAAASEEAAQEAREAIEGMTVTSETLIPEKEASVEKAYLDGVVNLHFGIPRGPSGVYVGSGPMPEGCNVQVDPDGDVEDIMAEIIAAGDEQIARIDEAVKAAVSPVATVTETDTGATITITDKNGTTTATVTNGRDGRDGVDGKDGAKGDKGDKGDPGADGKSGVYVGTDTPPAGTRVWINPNGSATTYAEGVSF